MRSASAHGLLHAPEYTPENLSNHFPMAMYALRELGATKEELEKLRGALLEKLEKVVRATDISVDQDNFSFYLGQRKAYLGYYHYFFERISNETPLPDFDALIPGIAAGAFHALIRLAYGLEAEQKSEIAAGLAYLADAYQDVGHPEPKFHASPRSTFSAFFKTLVQSHSSKALAVPELTGVIYQKMAQVSASPSIQQILHEIPHPSEITLAEIAASNLKLFLSTNNFTALHTVTATHAARIVASYLDDTRELTYQLAVSSTVAMLTIPAEQFSERHTTTAVPNSRELAERACQSWDEHDIKFVYSCIREFEYYNDPKYLAAAALRLSQD